MAETIIIRSEKGQYITNLDLLTQQISSVEDDLEKLKHNLSQDKIGKRDKSNEVKQDIKIIQQNFDMDAKLQNLKINYK